MATPDFRGLFELYRQFGGGQNDQLEPAQPRAFEVGPQSRLRGYPQQLDEPEAYGNYARAGGVLGGPASSGTDSPWWAQQLAAAGGLSFAGRPPASMRPGSGRFPPIPFVPNAVPEIPNPHIERRVPETTRNFWIAATLLPLMLGRGMLGEGKPNESTQESDEASLSKVPPEQPPNPDGSPLPWYVDPLEEERRRSAPSDDSERSGQPDPNFRQLTRVPFRLQPPIAAGREAGRTTPSGIESPPLVPEQEPHALAASSGGGSDLSGGGEHGGGGKNFCLDRWEAEYNDCDRFWMRETNRWRDACRARAGDRLRLCYRNGGTPNPDEPNEYSWKDIPKDNPRKK